MDGQTGVDLFMTGFPRSRGWGFIGSERPGSESLEFRGARI